MIKLDINEIKPGMILAQPVYNGDGVLLLESGSRITRKNIRIFKSWGLPQIAVRGDSRSTASEDESVPADMKISIENRLRKKFSDVLDDPVMTEILKAASRQVVKNLQAPEKNHESS